MSWRLRGVCAGGAVFALVVVTACGGSSKGSESVPTSTVPVGTVADSGFRPNQNGFSFQNYGGELSSGAAPVDMTAADVQKMFGDAVCADARSRKCDLIPEAQTWLDSTNAAMAGGHCYGFSVLAELLWLQRVNPTTFGAAKTTGLNIDSNEILQRQIAYDWALQTLDSVQSTKIGGTPNQVLNKLESTLRPRPSQTYTIAFWKPDFTGGHAVTPYSVENKGGGKFNVLIYDNNWPGETRAISFDTNTNSWTYDAAINPNVPDSVYQGDAKTQTIFLYPTSPGLGTQPCPFCAKVPKTTGGAPTSGNLDEISLLGGDTNHANLVVTDDAGRKMGYINGAFVDGIPGAHVNQVLSNQDWMDRIEPDFFVPANVGYKITIDGKGLKVADKETLDIVGPSYDVSIKNVPLDPGERDTLVFEPDATHLSYTSSRVESPTIEVGVSDTQADYSFDISGVSDGPGKTFNLTLPAEGGTLKVQNVGSMAGSSVNFKMIRETEQGVQVFAHNAIPLAVGDSAEFQFRDWTAATQNMAVATLHEGVQSNQTLANQAK